MRKAETNVSFVENLQNITQLLLKIETLEENKMTMKEKKWIENDRLFKERRFTLMGVLQQDLMLISDVTKHQYFLESVLHKRVA